jgi:hypothetical protein
MDKKKERKLDEIRNVLMKCDYEVQTDVDRLLVTGHDLPGIGKIAAMVAKCTVEAYGSKTLVVLR